MWNIIKIVDRAIPKITVDSLDFGQMFRYPKGTDPSNIYMKVRDNIGGRNDGVVLLSTGIIYRDFNPAMDIEVIDSISISR